MPRCVASRRTDAPSGGVASGVEVLVGASGVQVVDESRVEVEVGGASGVEGHAEVVCVVEVRRGDELLAIGHSSHGFMDRSGKGQRPPDDLVKLIEAAWIEV